MLQRPIWFLLLDNGFCCLTVGHSMVAMVVQVCWSSRASTSGCAVTLAFPTAGQGWTLHCRVYLIPMLLPCIVQIRLQAQSKSHLLLVPAACQVVTTKTGSGSAAKKLNAAASAAASAAESAETVPVRPAGCDSVMCHLAAAPSAAALCVHASRGAPVQTNRVQGSPLTHGKSFWPSADRLPLTSMLPSLMNFALPSLQTRTIYVRELAFGFFMIGCALCGLKLNSHWASPCTCLSRCAFSMPLLGCGRSMTA